MCCDDGNGVSRAKTRRACRRPRRARAACRRRVGLRRVAQPADAGVPQRVPVGRVERHEVAAAVTGEHQLARGGQKADAAAGAVDAGELVPPHRLAGLVVDRAQGARPRADLTDGLARESHRSARVGFGQVDDVEAVALVRVEQSGVRRVRGGGQFVTPPSTGETSEPGIVASFVGIGIGRAVLAQALGPVRRRPELRRHDGLARHAIDGEEVAVARRGRDELARLPVDRCRRSARASATSPSRACRAATSGSTRRSCRCRR